MAVARWRQYLAGYVVVRVNGSGIERFLNLAARQGVALEAVQRLGASVAVVRLPARQFARLRGPARRCGVGVRVVQRGGLPFVVRRLRRRPGLVVGAALGAALVAVLGSRVWEVRLQGPPELDRPGVLRALAELGLRPGAARGAVRPEQVERELLLVRPEVAWADVRLHGSVAVVEVRLRRDGEGGVGATGDVVASHGGLVTELSVLQGWAVVHPGEVVRRGQVLISGGSGDSAVRAAGWVKARVWAEGYGESRLQVEVVEPAGRLARGFSLRVGPWRWQVGAVVPPFRRYRRVAGGRLRLPGPGALLPVEVEHVTYEQLTARSIPIGLPEARRLAEEAAMARALEQLGPQPHILEVRRATWEEQLGRGETVVRSRVQVEALQEIGRFQPHAVPAPARPGGEGTPLVRSSPQVYTGGGTPGRAAGPRAFGGDR